MASLDLDLGEGGIKDILPLPANMAAHAEGQEEQANTLRQNPTDSHRLATASHEKQGAAQLSHDEEVRDVGWHENDHRTPNPLIGGMTNEQLWMLVRRFNKQMYHVKEYTRPPPGNLDLEIADEEEFSPDKLRSNFERLYMTLGIGSMGFGKHIMRLRSWNETRRTAAFCGAYTIAWLFDLLVPLLLTTLVTLIVYPPSRVFLFPPAPLALVSGSTGGLQKPKAGVLGSTDSATGAPQNYKGEAVEAEASNFFNALTQVALASASGKHPQGDPPTKEQQEKGASAEESVPDPATLAMGASEARTKAAGGNEAVTGKRDTTKVAMETAIWNKMRPAMHGLAQLVDTYERFGNALSPTAPFPRDIYRLRIASLLVPLLAASFFISAYMVVKGITFGIGFGFFGDPIIQRGLQWLNSTFPHWQRLLEIRNTILKGVPTNAQLTLTLLRIGEANKSPVPPPVYAQEPPSFDDNIELEGGNHIDAVAGDNPLGASDAELKAAVAPEQGVADETHREDVMDAKKKHGKKGSKILSIFKTGIKGTVETVLGADHLKAKAGSHVSKQRLGVIPGDRTKHLTGPVDFKSRYHGKRGHTYISTKATIPCVSFTLDKSVAKLGSESRSDEDLNPIWSVAVGDIRSLRKLGGLGWKSKLLVGWALDTEVADGLEIIDRQGNIYVLTAMVLRDELFNRLIAMGGQKWESW